MKLTESIAGRTLQKMCGVMNREILLSKQGIGEPDTDFIWGSTFRAPIGISFIGENVFFNFVSEKSPSGGGMRANEMYIESDIVL